MNKLAILVCISSYLFIHKTVAYSKSTSCGLATWNCHDRCSSLSTHSDTCHYHSHSSCGFLHAGKQCHCTCTQADCNSCGDECNREYCFSNRHGDCTLDDIKGASGTCNVGNLQHVGEEIGKQRWFNLAEVGFGATPIGFATDAVFAIWDPTSPITSPFTLVNDLRDEINAEIKKLEGCMDSKISTAKTDLYHGMQQGIYSQFDTIKGAVADAKQEYITSLFIDFNRKIGEIFGVKQSSYLDYQNMLPVYQALYQLWATVSADQLNIRGTEQDCVNFENDLNTVKNAFNTFKTWITWARASIIASLTPPNHDTASCGVHAKSGLFGGGKAWINSNPDYFSATCDSYSTTHDSWRYCAGGGWDVSFKTSLDRQTSCNLDMKGGYTYGQGSADQHKICDTLWMGMRQTRNEIMNELREYESWFDDTYVDPLADIIAETSESSCT